MFIDPITLRPCTHEPEHLEVVVQATNHGTAEEPSISNWKLYGRCGNCGVVQGEEFQPQLADLVQLTGQADG